MYNEEANVKSTISEVVSMLDVFPDWEIVVVDDGSTDRTGKLLREMAIEDRRIRVLTHPANMGRGLALRTGFASARKDVIVTLDADLSYDVGHIPRLVGELANNGGADIVVGSPYMKGGAVQGIPPGRLLLSKIANKVLSFALPGKLHTVTGILRAYKRGVIESLELESADKEIHLEILVKAEALGYKAKEIPATLRNRRRGKSKLKVRATIFSHLMFSFYEKPFMLFGAIGLIMVLAAMLMGGYLFAVWLKGQLNPERPLMAITVTLFVAGIQIFFFGFVSTQIANLRRELYKIQKNGIKSRISDESKLRNEYDSLSIVAAGRRELE